MEKHPLRGRGALWLGIPPGYQLKNLIHGTVALMVAEAVPAQSPVSASLEGPFWAEANPSRNHAAGAFEANRLAGTPGSPQTVDLRHPKPSPQPAQPSKPHETPG